VTAHAFIEAVYLGDLAQQLGVGAGPSAGNGFAGLVVGGFGDLEQLARAGHVCAAPALPPRQTVTRSSTASHNIASGS
jgi:hypothetical protein